MKTEKDDDKISFFGWVVFACFMFYVLARENQWFTAIAWNVLSAVFFRSFVPVMVHGFLWAFLVSYLLGLIATFVLFWLYLILKVKLEKA